MRKPAATRAAWLDPECSGEVALRQRVDALLAAHEQPERLLATQPDAARLTIKFDLADAPDVAMGQTLGHYKLLERVGESGCGVVYASEPTKPVRRRVAGNLTGAEAAQQAGQIGARLVVPGHYDLFAFNTATPDEFVAACRRLNQPCRVLRLGERLSLRPPA